MNRNEFNRFVAGGALPGPGDLEGLREMTVLFPWFHSAHLVLLRGLKENADVRFDSQLKASALSVSDREVLYHYLFMSPEAVVAREEDAREGIAQEEIRHKEEVSETAAIETEIRHEEEIPETAAIEDERHEEVVHEEAVIEEIVQEEVLPEAEVGEEIIEEAVSKEEVVQEEAPPEAEVREEIIEEDLREEFIEEAVSEAEVPLEDVIPGVDVKEEISPEPVRMEDTAQEAAPVAEESALRTREELMAEIEARLEELASVKKEILELIAEPASDIPETIIEEKITEPEEIVEEKIAAPEATVEEQEEEPEEIAEEGITAPEATVEKEETEQEPEPIIEEEEPEPEQIIEEEEPEPEPAAEELIEFIEDSEPAADTTAPQLSSQALIDRFIKSSPTLERMTLPEIQPVRDLSETSAEEKGSFITETLAKIYINQGYYSRAINIYEKLSLQYPEKSAYFAGRIEKINDLIK